jgi:hypothetical protein
MRHLTYIFLILLIIIQACGKKDVEKTVKSEVKKTQIFNISQIPQFKSMKKIIATFENFERKTIIIQSPNVKDIFVTVTFPFSYKVLESYVSKGSSVKKGDKLFLISSDEMVSAYKEYITSRNEELGKKLLSIGIDLTSQPSPNILLISPDEGTVVFLPNERVENSLIPQNTLAIIQKKSEIIFNILVPEERYTTEIYFYAIIGDRNYPLEVVSEERDNKVVKVNLALKGFNIVKDNLESVKILMVNIIQNAVKIPKDVVFKEDESYYCFVQTSEEILEKRGIEGFFEEDFFIVTFGINQMDKIINENPTTIKNFLKI